MEAKFNGKAIDWAGDGAYRLNGKLNRWLPVHPDMVKALEMSGTKVVFISSRNVTFKNVRLFRGQEIEWSGDGVYTFSKVSHSFIRVTNFGEVEAAAQNGFEILFIYECDTVEA